MAPRTRTERLYRTYLALLGAATAVAVVGAVFAAWAAGNSTAATTVAPTNTVEPRISGTTRVGQVLRTSRGQWTGTGPIQYSYRWFRCKGRGAADASDCTRVPNAGDNAYALREADAGFQIRSQVVATNADGSTKATSNPTGVVTSARPTNTKEPSITGTATVGGTLQANRGEWAGEQPITYSYIWLRCDAQGDNCSEIPGANDTQYTVKSADNGHTLRVRVTGRNDRGSTSAISNPTSAVGGGTPPPPPTGGIPVGSLQAAGDRLIISQVRFSPNPVRSRTAPITVRVQITARGGRAVNGARVFMRATPRVVTGQTQVTGGDGYATLTLVPNGQFPQPRNGFNVQFFVKAYRAGDPPLGGIAGYRLVQVRLAS
jgi:hypothetical protein